MLIRNPVVCAALAFQLADLTTPAAAAHNAEPVVIFSRAWPTSSAHSDPPPAWLVVPALLDFQPVVLQVDVRRDAKAQLRRFCHAHSVDLAKCAVLHDALHEIVDLDRLCSQQAKRLESPSFMVVKNLILSKSAARDGSEQLQPGKFVASFQWVQDAAENIAVDLCRFAQSGGGGEGSSRVDMSCVDALEAALLRSLDWINSLEPCDHIAKQDAKAVEVASLPSSHNDQLGSTMHLKDRISSVEHLIAELTSQQKTIAEETHRDEAEKDIVQVISDEQAGASGFELAQSDDAAELPEAMQPLNDEKNASEAKPLTLQHPDAQSRSHQNVSSHSTLLHNQVPESDLPEQDHLGTLDEEVASHTKSEHMEEDAVAGSGTSEQAPPVREPIASEYLEIEEVSTHHLSQESLAEESAENSRDKPKPSADANVDHHHHEPRSMNGDDLMGLTDPDASNAREETQAVVAELKMVADDGERQMGETPGLGGTDALQLMHDENATLPTVPDLPASSSNCSSSIENSSATTKEMAEASLMQQTPAIAAIGMPEAAEVLPAVEAPSPEMLRSLSTLAMLFFVLYLIFDLLSIATRYLVNLETLHKCGNKAVQVVLSLFSFFIRSESKSTLRVNSAESSPPVKEDTNTKKQQSDEPQKESLARRPSLSPTQVPSPRSWATVLFSSSGGRRSSEGDSSSFQRRIQAVDKMAKAYIRRIQRTAFGIWRLGSMQIGESAPPPSSLVRRQETTDDDTSAADTNGTTAVELVERRPQRPSFTCVAMALMFAKHGSHRFHAINHAASSTNDNNSDDERAKPRLSRALFKLLEDSSTFENKNNSPTYCAAQRIQQTWRLKHKKPVAARLSISTTSPTNLTSENPRSTASTPSTPLFALLNKDRKRSASNAHANSAKPAFPIRRVMTPASSMHLPPCS